MKTYLFAVPSSCQMYSGTGTAIFDWIKFSKTYFDFTFLMDRTHELNYETTQRFCADNNVPLVTSQNFTLPGCPDPGIAKVAELFALKHFDYVECVSWANAATNLQVLSAIPDTTHLVFTPHSQPLWTLGQPTRFPMIGPVFRRMVGRADTLMLDSPLEQEMELFSGSEIRRAVHARLGVDTSTYRFDASKVRHRNHILSICDFREHRKRFDCLLAGFERALEMEPDLKLVIAGKNSDLVYVPSQLEAHVVRKGYIQLDELVELYQTSGQFCLLSDYEAFGLPIAEALCCGLPVLINAQREITAIFADFPGVAWVTNTDSEAVANHLVARYRSPVESHLVAQQAVMNFALDKAYQVKLNALTGN